MAEIREPLSKNRPKKNVKSNEFQTIFFSFCIIGVGAIIYSGGNLNLHRVGRQTIIAYDM